MPVGHDTPAEALAREHLDGEDQQALMELLRDLSGINAKPKNPATSDLEEAVKQIKKA